MGSQAGEQVYLSDIPISPLELQKDFEEITHNEIQTNIRSLPNKKAPGPDLIPNELLKITGQVILKNLQNLLNFCLKIGYFPQTMEESYKHNNPKSRQKRLLQPISIPPNSTTKYSG
ncbi:hypothetical protein O181_064123 [Austropuccinia psidii MF-1]|uniref:Uncharacterized protein n=1 Tax=Austropuccinia psidii MF-1 TaxID=1389203 RepID=A0A9Q3I1A1_9BASI|nr:hypothetical protein [Austropuccinia psidii MF-1]